MIRQEAVKELDKRGGLAANRMENFDIEATWFCDKCLASRPPGPVLDIGWYQGDNTDYCPGCQDDYHKALAQFQALTRVTDIMVGPTKKLEWQLRAVIPEKVKALERVQGDILNRINMAVSKDELDDETHRRIIKNMALSMEKLKGAYYGKQGK